MSYTKAEQLYEGKAKKVFAIKENPDYVMVSYKDDATAFNGLKKGQIHGKGVINNKMTNYMFSLLEKRVSLPTLSRRSTTARPLLRRLRSFRWKLS